MGRGKKAANADCEHKDRPNFRRGLCYACWRLECNVASARKVYDRKSYLLNSCNIKSKAVFCERMVHLFPSVPPTQDYCTSLWTKYQGLLHNPITIPTTKEEVQCLLHFLNIAKGDTMQVFIDPCSGTCTINSTVREVLGVDGFSYIDKDIKTGFDAVNPLDWRTHIQTQNATKHFISSPPWQLMDLFLADLYRRCDKDGFVALHTASDYSVNTPAHRQHFNHELESKQLLTRVVGLPLVGGRRRAVWVVLFKTKATRDKVWKGVGDVATVTVV